MTAEFPFRTLRDNIAFLESKGQLAHLKEEVDLRAEVAAISGRIYARNGPAVLYENIKGYPGWRIFTDGLTTRQRIAWILGMENDAGLNQRLQEMKKRTVKPMVVNTGPCKEVKLFGDDIDLIRIPVPHHTYIDSPPYFASGVVICKDPETGFHNSGITRHQILGKALTTNKIESFQQQNIIYERYAKDKKPCPGAICIGGDELYTLCAMFPAPWGVPEWDYWGSITGEPFQLVKAETVDLLVPANAEIIIEGNWHPSERILEGPHSEVPGFLTAMRMALRFDVTCITMRENPIYRYLASGRGPYEVHTAIQAAMGSELYVQLKSLMPEVSDVGMHGGFTVVSVQERTLKIRHGFANRVGMAVRAVDAGKFMKNVVVIPDSLDAQNVNDVLWAFSAYYQPNRDILVIPELPGGVVDPSEPYNGGALGYREEGHTSFGIYDCTPPRPPYDEPYKRGVANPTPSVFKMVDEKWSSFGLP